MSSQRRSRIVPLLAIALVLGLLLGAIIGRSTAPKAVETVVEKFLPAPPEKLPSKRVSYRSRMDVTELFNGMTVNSELNTTKGGLASVERKTPGSYEINFDLSLRVPEPSKTMGELQKLNPNLGAILPGLPSMVSGGEVSGFYHYIYKLKQEQVQTKITRLEQALSRHNFYDCETILELEHAESKQKVLLMQGEMDVVADGSDGDRMPTFDDYVANSTHFQATTSYGWRKVGNQPNPLVARMERKLAKAEERYKVSGLTRGENASLEYQIEHLPETIEELKRRSFLIAQEDPFIVIPLSTRKYDGFNEYTPLVGDYALVVYGDKIVPAIVGDYGPAIKTGEGSLRLAKYFDSKATPYRRPVSDLTVTYVIFPNSREKPFRQPNLDYWHKKCLEYAQSIGGIGNGYELHRWKDSFAHLRNTGGADGEQEGAGQ